MKSCGVCRNGKKIQPLIVYTPSKYSTSNHVSTLTPNSFFMIHLRLFGLYLATIYRRNLAWRTDTQGRLADHSN